VTFPQTNRLQRHRPSHRGDIFNTWLNAEKGTPEQWGDEPWSSDQIPEKADKLIKLGLSIVEMVPLGDGKTAQERVPVAI
jgi:hypothetical protein